MKLLRRILAVVSVIAMMANPYMTNCYTAYAESETETTTETNNGEVSDTETEPPVTQTTTASSTTEATQITAETETTITDDVEVPDTEPEPPVTEITTTETEATETPTVETEVTTEEENPEEPPEKLPAPSIMVTIPDGWKKNTDDWKITTDEGVEIYYEISDSDFPPADEVPENLLKWQVDKVPEGIHNIRFWAIHPDNNHNETVSYTNTYYLDETAPSEFSLNVTEEKTDDNKNILVVSNANPVIENGGSGIKRIYYTINDNEEKQSDIDYTVNEEGINFSFKIEEPLKDAVITVTAVDNADNEQSASVPVESFDSKPPVITDINLVNISYNETDSGNKKPDEIILQSKPYGEKGSDNYTDYIYASNNSYLKIKINDDYNDLKIKVYANDKEFEFSAEELLKAENGLSHNGVYYIPVSKFEINNSETCQISVVAEDSRNSSTFSLENFIFYDSIDENDSKIAISYEGEYISRDNPDFPESPENNYDLYFTNMNNSVSVTVSDDTGISEYEIKLNGETLKSENFIDEDKMVKVPETCIIPLQQDGKYTVEVSVTDLAGTKKKQIKNICVDSSAPEITDLKCNIVDKNTFLHYVTFGIYSNKSISLQFKVNDDLSGVSDVFLYWDKEEPYQAEYNESTGTYTFNNLSIGGNAPPRIEAYDRLGHKAVYYFENSGGNKLDNIVNLTDDIPDNNVNLILEDDVPEFNITPAGKYYKTEDTDEIYFGVPEENVNNNIFVNIQDNNGGGIWKYQIKIFQDNQEIHTGESHDLLTEANNAVYLVETSLEKEGIKLDELASGDYDLCVEVIDLAGNKISDENKYVKFHIDKTAPEINGNNFNYEVTSSILKYFTFGIFGKDSISMSLDVNEQGCGIKKVSLYWAPEINGELTEYPFVKDGNGRYTVSGLTPSGKAVPYIKITDNLENTSKYYFTSESITINESQQFGELVLDTGSLADSDKVSLMLENDAPVVSVTVPENYTKYQVNNEIWYSEKVEYCVKATDKESGLNRIIVNENGEQKEVITSTDNGENFDEIQQLEQVEKNYTVTEGKYNINVKAYDNAFNESAGSQDSNLAFNIDTTNPEITGFNFGGQKGEGFEEETETYGFYFQEETEVKVFVSDKGTSSGINYVVLYSVDSNGITTSLQTSLIEKADFDEDADYYAKFTIPVGFKGRVYAQVVDNVERKSEFINADGSIVEDKSIHDITSSVNISAPPTDKRDAENRPLYKESILLEITLNDSFSGIAKIEWSVDGDEKNGIIYIDNQGNPSTDDLTIISTDRNLVTSAKFNILVENNINGNNVNIKLTDRSGNVSEINEIYSIDTTPPVIQTSFENNDVRNKSHYKAEQKVNIIIYERNFNGSDVHILLNGKEQHVTWNDDRATVGQDDAKHEASFTISEDGDYTYEVRYTDRAGNEAKTFISDEFTIDTQKPTAEISFEGNYKKISRESGEELYFGVPEDNKPNIFNVTANDTNGLEYYQVSISDENGNIIEEYDRKYSFSPEPHRIKKHKADEINFNNLKSGKYTISVYAVDLAGNEIDTEKNHLTFYVDIDAPEIQNSQYRVTDSLLKYFTFGIFGNTTISLSADINDNVTGCGIERASLFWTGKNNTETVAYTPANISGSTYTFNELPVNCEGVPYIEVVDYMGNLNTYYFKTVESGSAENNIGELIANQKTDVLLELEDIQPVVNVSVPETYPQYNVNGEIWYGGDVEYKITAVDRQSGLNQINVQENGNITTLFSKDNVQFISQRYRDEVEYTYPATEANDYNINVSAVDNAGNITDDNSITFHIDKENPQIRMFRFENEIDNGSDYERTTYGFYFMNDTEARVYVADPGVTSGFQSVTLLLSGIDNTSQSTTVPGTSLYTDENGTYASFVIPMGFKGKVIAEVIDNVGHSSGNISADGNIIENESIHSQNSSIDISEDISTNNTDANGIPLYNQNIPLTITVSDQFSGISEIEWSVSDDNKSGVISIDNNGNPSTADLTILSTESNLVTAVQFNIPVESNTNGNTVSVKLTDRSGNVSEVSKIYSIDKTVPSIEANLVNTNVHNESYYTGSQTVNIRITERNFNSEDVHVLLNGTEQNISWSDVGASIGEDSSVHYGSFDVTADGDYIYEINYTDRAGNIADTVKSSQFTIDNTQPTADISFDFGDPNIENAYYNKPRTAIFTINEHNYNNNAKITIRKNGFDISDTFDLDNWNRRSNSGDVYVQNVTFSENGRYEIDFEVTDMSDNKIKTSSKGFFIDNDSPVVSVSVENVADGEPSNAKIIEPLVFVEDKEGNLDPETVTLKITTIKLDENNEIVPEIQTYIGLEEWQNSNLGTVTLDDETNPDKIEFSLNNLEDDGIYTFEVTASDRAGNTGGVSDEDKENGAKYKISVNRLGSTYDIDLKITNVSPDMRYFRNNEESPFSFRIVEYNVSHLKKNETIIKMTCDGTIVDNNISAEEEIGSDKWSVYTYDFPSELMETSGKYIVKLYSVDEAGNSNPVNDEDERATITFFIDNDAPIVYFRDADDKTEFMSKKQYKTDNKRIEVEVYENSQKEVRNVVFKLNGDDEPEKIQHKEGTMIYTFNISGKDFEQNLSLSLEDIAGNRIDTGVDNFLITTNSFALWYNNTPLFVGTLAVIAFIILNIVLIWIKKKKNNNNNNNNNP
ncbi:MAG: Ig-like domain repeat protein [Ruminococcus sp.]|nr:Ig-like domain repeat protein [Ruminococcus sp.]